MSLHEGRPVRLVFYTEVRGFAGGEGVLSHLLNGLSSESFEITCICTSETTMIELQRRQSRPGVSFIRFDLGPRPSVWRTVIPLARLLRSLRPDIVHCNSIDQHAGAYAILAGRLIGVPVVIGTIHTAGPHPQSSPLETLYAWTVDHLLHRVILVSEYSSIPVLRDRHLNPAKLTVIHNGIAFPSSSPEAVAPRRQPSSGRALRIGSAGVMIPRKDFATLIQAVAHLDRAASEISATIFGDGPERGHLQQLVRERDLGDVVTFPGWQDDIRTALQTLDIFVLPSLNENAALVLLEAMACSLPIVATDVGAIPEIVVHGETGLLVPPRDPRAMAEAIGSLIADPAKRAAFGRAGRRRFEARFTAERMVSDTARLYGELLKG